MRFGTGLAFRGRILSSAGRVMRRLWLLMIVMMTRLSMTIAMSRRGAVTRMAMNPVAMLSGMAPAPVRGGMPRRV
jgi:hypothetical protein